MMHVGVENLMDQEKKRDKKPHFARITIELDSETRAKRVCNAVSPELNVLGYDRTEASIFSDKNKVVLEIKARDLVGLRAAIGSSLRWLAVSVQTLEKVCLS